MKGPSRIRRHLIELAMAAAGLGATIPLALTVLPNWTNDRTTPKPKRAAFLGAIDPTLLANPCIRGSIALTFDDGPDIYTPQILQILRAYHVQATFYAMGKKAKARPDLIRAEIADGHLVENHSWDHPHLGDLNLAAIAQQLTATQAAITAAGAPAPTQLRPPFGNVNPRVQAAADALHLKIVMWSLDTNDWRGRTPDEITNTVLTQAVPGASVLMHDGVANSVNTVKALPAIIRGLRQAGFCTTLYRPGEAQPGKAAQPDRPGVPPGHPTHPAPSPTPRHRSSPAKSA